MAPGDFKVMSHKMTNSLEIHTLQFNAENIYKRKNIYLITFFKPNLTILLNTNHKIALNDTKPLNLRL